MISKYRMALIATLSCLHSLAAKSQHIEITSQLYMPLHAPAPRSAKQGPQRSYVRISPEGSVAASGALDDGYRFMDFYSPFSGPFAQGGRGAAGFPQSARSQTKSVHLGPGLALASAPECGASPLSVEDIQTLVAATAGRYGVDLSFALAIVWTESRFDRVRNSPKGARGPMQLMPETAKRFDVADVCDPADNIDGGMRYLRALLDKFKSPIIAAAAYNAGEQAVYDSGGIPAYPETVRYVASVINRQLGLDFPAKRTGRSRNQSTDIDNTLAGDVLRATTPKFIGGVMQF